MPIAPVPRLRRSSRVPGQRRLPSHHAGDAVGIPRARGNSTSELGMHREMVRGESCEPIH
eukprot:14204695-Alexandrium_andersonii.AAC.1